MYRYSDTPYENEGKDKYSALLRHRRKRRAKGNPITIDDIDMEAVGGTAFSYSDTPYENQEKEKYVQLLKKHNYDLRGIKEDCNCICKHVFE